MTKPRPTSPNGLLVGIYSDVQIARATLRALRRRPHIRAALLLDAGTDPVAAAATALDGSVLDRYRPFLLDNEALLLIEAAEDEIPAAYETLRQSRGGRPATFVFHPPASIVGDEEAAAETAGPPLPAGEQEAAARHLAEAMGDTDEKTGTGRAGAAALLGRLARSEAALQQVGTTLELALQVGQAIPLSGEWLLDNAYILKGHIEDTQRSLTPRFCARLPAGSDTTHGRAVGEPRVSVIAAALVSVNDARLDADVIRDFVQSFQTITPLHMGELWALPLLLRLHLIEVVRAIASRVERRQREAERADFGASRLLSAARRGPERLADIIAALKAETPTPSPYMADQLVGHLYDEEAALAAARAYLEEAGGASLPDLIARGQRDQAADQVTISNAIGSLRRLGTVDWREVFESLSLVHGILADDPLGVYARMDFATRDLYRHAVEEIALHSPTEEIEVAEMARALAQPGEDDLRRHIGYYLLDKGRPVLEQRAGFVPPLLQRFRTLARRCPVCAYAVPILLLTLLFVSLAARVAAGAGTSPWLLSFLILLALLPASELSVQIVNQAMIQLFPPDRLPRLDLVKNGIPDDLRTLVVVPMMLLTPEAIATEVERLEIRYLGNPDPNLRFGLLADYADAPLQHMPEDAERLDVAVRSIETLNERYGQGRFFLFHRDRTWSDSEERWIGWERKRGKLERLNAFLLGEHGAETEGMLRVGDRRDLGGIRYVITLDADTQLPRDTARMMVGTIAHPLNQPRLSLDGRGVERGYTIIQPRVSTVLPSATETWFTHLFTPSAGTDPYTNAISDVYQDMAHEGSYHGKGVYDLSVFHRVLGDRFPEAHLLSHDLLEGSHVRVGLATQIELFDQFPRDYPSFARRQHRWIRGDWQIADWLLPRVPASDGSHVPNPLNALSRWKIFDNLRRSLVPVASVLLVTLAWLLTPTPAFWTLLVLAPLLLAFPLSFARLIVDPARVDARSWRALLLVPLRALVDSSLLPHQALLSVNAIVLVIERRLTRRHLLEWETAADSTRRARNRQQQFVLHLLWVPGAALALLTVLALREPAALLSALPLLALWAGSPLVVTLLGRDAVSGPSPSGSLTGEDRRLLRGIARQTWRYFDDFVGPQSHYLPPDNFQEFENVGVAPRTSPTNIGLGLLSVLAAYDLGYITADGVIQRTRATLETLNKLEKFEGNLLNWYDTNTAEALKPRYVSTVDSSNLLGCLWTFVQGCDDLLESPLASAALLHGMNDTLTLLQEALSAAAAEPLGPDDSEALNLLGRLLADDSAAVGLDDCVGRLRDTLPPIARLVETFAVKDAATPPATENRDPLVSSRYWTNQLRAQATDANALIDRYLSWVPIVAESAEQGLFALGKDAHEWRRQALEAAPSLHALARGDVPGLAPLSAALSRADALGLSSDTRLWLERLRDAFEISQTAAREMVARAEETAQAANVLAAGTNLRFLYAEDRRAFRIGYNVEDRRADNSFYDLLASESRLGSFVAVARGEVPTEHWWALGRPYGSVFGRRVLLSWSGTMFEYLMPNLLMRPYDGSLLAEANEVAVACQIAYARERGIPWGISEAAHSALDAGHIYQYFAFGVPGVGLKRGLEDSLVIAPYATALALMVDPVAAVGNLRRLAALGLRGDRGFYEAIDYTRQRLPEGERGVVVQTFMAHHQGMSLLAIDNLLCGDPMRRRFHADRRVAASEPLLHERIPSAPPLSEGYAGDVRSPALPRVAPAPTVPPRSHIDKPDTRVPRTLLLSNGTYHVMVTNSGGGYSRWNDIEVTRWHADATRDDAGTFVYLRDMDTGAVWSAGYQPSGVVPQSFSVQFTTERAEFRRRDNGIETVMEVTVSPEDDAEIRRITLHNRTGQARRIELTSYVEVALAPHAADRAHPAFSKMFVETEAYPDAGGKVTALLARRRPRSATDAPLWAAHSVTGGDPVPSGPGFETDRAAFLGRRRTTHDPAALEAHAAAPLGGAVGPVLDPIFSLRRVVTVQPGERVQVCFLVAAGSSRDALIKLTEKYNDPHAATRAFELAWNRAQLELRHLGITIEDAQRFQQLAGGLLYPNNTLRAPAPRLAQNTLPQSGLWKHGISGDLPILLVTIRDIFDAYVVREALMAHTYWRLHGLKVDLVIFNEEGGSYERPVQDQLGRLAQAHSQYTALDQPGGVFVRAVADLPREERTLLLTVARIVLVAARGPLAQQLALAAPAHDAMPAFVLPVGTPPLSDPPPALPFIERSFFNGFGGFTLDGREYVIDRAAGDPAPPQPWSNVLANERFGMVVTDSGSGFCWDGNSQANRLTTWSNDPVSDTPGDALFIRDEESGRFWTPTALPAAAPNAAYRTRHGQGYTIFEHESHGLRQELTTFVPVDAAGIDVPARLQILRLRNASGRPRRLAVFAYAAWVLGTEREDTQMHVVTEWDNDANALLARNAYRADFADRIAFVAAVGATVLSHTGDRTEFIGRNGSLAAPFALTRVRLSGQVGAGLDPCGALHGEITLGPDEEREIVFLLGEGDSREHVGEIVKRFSAPGAARAALESTQGWWSGLLETVQVETPDADVGFLLNRWLLYQDLSCRVWGRSAFYQSGGAFGFRDQLQDVLALVYAAPQSARAQIVRSAARQFEQGDVQHWWHPPGGAGVRTRISDDLLWLPYVVAQYVRITGDSAILDEVIPFLRGPELTPDQHESLFTPEVSPESATLLEHCRRAIARGRTAGPLHGLPLIGAGDWNDGLNRVGIEGKGESVWLAWFLVHVLDDFAALLEFGGNAHDEAAQFRADANALAQRIEETAWDGAWYRRGTFDDGTPLGSHESDEARIDSLPQSWAVISGHGDPERAEIALRAVDEQLVRRDCRIVMLFTPPFDKTAHDPGYIKGYPPGVRENGGQYTHGSLWVPFAFARRGDGDRAVELLHLMNPVRHAQTNEQANHYRVEPYVVTADIYALAGNEGRGGWSWYTGSAGWMYRVWLEEVLGFRLSGGDRLTLDPRIPRDWPGCQIRYRYRSATYIIAVENPDKTGSGVVRVELDGTEQPSRDLTLTDDGGTHNVRIILGAFPMTESPKAPVARPKRSETKK